MLLLLMQNLDTTGPRSVRIKPPTTKWFKVKGVDHTERIAPGLSITFEVSLQWSVLHPLSFCPGEASAEAMGILHANTCKWYRSDDTRMMMMPDD